MNVYINNSLSIHGSLGYKAEHPTFLADPLQSPIDADKPSSTSPCEPLWQQLVEQIKKDNPTPTVPKDTLNKTEAERIQEQIQKNQAAIQLLRSWREEGDEEEQRETMQYLREVLDEDRLSDRKFFA